MKPGLLFVTFTFERCFNLRPELRRMFDKNNHSLNMLAVTLRGRLCCVRPITHKSADFTVESKHAEILINVHPLSSNVDCIFSTVLA